MTTIPSMTPERTAALVALRAVVADLRAAACPEAVAANRVLLNDEPDALDAALTESFGQPITSGCHAWGRWNPNPTGFNRSATWNVDGCRIERRENRFAVYAFTSDEIAQRDRATVFVRTTPRVSDEQRAERRQMGITF